MTLNDLPSSRQLAYLIALVETGHFGRAALKCAVTQSTLSAGLKELESILGMTLVERTKRRVVVTPLGRAVAARAREALHYLEDLVDLARAGKTELAGPLNLGIIPTIAPYLLPRLVDATAKAFPRVRLFVREEQTAPILARLRRGELDLALIALPYDTAGLDTAEIGAEDMVVCMPARHALAPGKTVRVADLKSVPLLMLEGGHCLRDHALAACRIPASALNEVFQATSLPTLVAMVAGGAGLTLLPRMAAARELAGRSDLVVRPFDKARPMRSIALAWRSAAAQGETFAKLAKVWADAKIV